MRLHKLTLCATALALAACGEGSGPTISAAAKLAIARFDYLADLTAPPPGVALVGDAAGDGWFSIAGTASNQGINVTGVCARPRQETPGVRYSCHRATYRWSADFTAGESAGDAIGTEHHVVIPSTVVAGAILSITGFTDDLGARIGDAPIRSRLALKRDRARARR